MRSRIFILLALMVLGLVAVGTIGCSPEPSQNYAVVNSTTDELKIGADNNDSNAVLACIDDGYGLRPRNHRNNHRHHLFPRRHR